MQDLERIESGLHACTSQPEAPTVCFVSKMVAVPHGALSTGRNPNTNGTVFVGFGRVFCGVLRDGDTVHVLSAAYSPARPHLHRQEVKVCILPVKLGHHWWTGHPHNCILACLLLLSLAASCTAPSATVPGIMLQLLRLASMHQSSHCNPMTWPCAELRNC